MAKDDDKEKGGGHLPSDDSYASKQARLAHIVGAVQKEYKGKAALTLMSDHSLDIPRVSTGILGLDIALDGGIPRGRIIEIFGAEETGKTTMCAAILANAQRCCMRCGKRARFEIKGTVKVKMPMGQFREVPNHVIANCPCGDPKQCTGSWLDFEGSFSPEWFEAKGVWLEHCYLSRPDNLEMGIDIGQAVIESNEFDFFFVDSVAMGTSEEEMEKSSGDSVVGVNARKWNSAMRKWQTEQNRRYNEAMNRGDSDAASMIPTVVLINQIRMKIGVMFGNPETTVGGRGVGFAASARIRTSDAGMANDSEDKEVKTGHKLKYMVKKSKVSASRHGGEYELMQIDTEYHKKGEIDQDKDLRELGMECGVIESSGKTHTIAGVFEEATAAAAAKAEKNGGDLPLRVFRKQEDIELFFAQNHAEAQRVYDEIVFRMTGTRY